MIGFDKGRQVIVEHLSSSDNIDNIRSYIGNYMWWGGSSAPSGTFPVSMQSNLSLMLFVRSVGSMSIQTMYTGVAASGIINHKYERVYTDVWGKWTDMGTINSPH